MKLRKRNLISYYEPDEPSFDDYIYCDKCEDFVYEYCSIHGALLVIPDDDVRFDHTSRVPRAALTIPKEFLHIAPSVIPGAGLGVFATLTLPRGVRFGPYCGEILDNVESSYCWQIYEDDSKSTKVVDASDAGTSNWMRYVNCARHFREQNLVAYQYRGQIYYRTIKIVPRFTELLVFYGGEFAQLLGINLRHYNTDEYYFKIHGAALANSLCRNKIPENKTVTTQPVTNNHLQPFEVGTIDDFFLISDEDVEFHNIPPAADPVSDDLLDYSKQYTANITEVENIETLSSLTCELCSKTFNKRFNLTRHRITVHGLNPNNTLHEKSVAKTNSDGEDSFATYRKYTCDICFKTLSSDRCLKRHTRDVHGVNVSNSNIKLLDQCPLKTDDFSDGYGASNIRTDSLATAKDNTCDICSKTLSTYRSLKRHKIEVHRSNVASKLSTELIKTDDDTKYEDISAKTDSNDSLATSKEFVCEICFSALSSERSLKRHNKLVHKANIDSIIKPKLYKQYKCAACEQFYFNKRHVYRHYEECHGPTTHLEVKPTYVSVNNENLPEACDLCGFRTTCKRNVQKHMGRFHKVQFQSSF